MVIVLHTNKGTGTSERELLMGSVGYGAASRNTLIVGLDVDEPDGDGPLRAFVHGTKHNLGRHRVGHKLEIIERDVKLDDGSLASFPVFVERGETRWTSAEVLLAGKKPDAKLTPGEECAECIGIILAEGPLLDEDLVAKAKAYGHSANAIRDAKKLLGVKPKPGEFGGKYVCELPVFDGPDAPSPSQSAKTD